MKKEGRPARKVILDCDPGTDDAIAILLALASPELDVAAITVSGGNAPLARTLANACALATLSGCRVPVHAGAAGALLAPYPPGWKGQGEDGMAGVALPPGAAPASALAHDAIRTILRQARRKVTLVGIGPATNLALALACEPLLATQVEEIVLMSGARGEGNATPGAEFNAWCDPEALAMILAARRKLTLATLECGRIAAVTAARLVAFRAAAGGRASATAAAILSASLASHPDGVPLYDPCALAWLIAPHLFEARPAAVVADLGPGPSRGRTAIDHRGRANARLLQPLDPDALFALLAQRIARLP